LACQRAKSTTLMLALVQQNTFDSPFALQIAFLVDAEASNTHAFWANPSRWSEGENPPLLCWPRAIHCSCQDTGSMSNRRSCTFRRRNSIRHSWNWP